MAKLRRLSPRQILAIGFALIILIGALLLSLPVASRTTEPVRFLDALFTAASAACVTGLVVFDTWTQFTFFGQLIILILIQIGGLGFMTIAIIISMALGKRIGLTERSCLAEGVCALQLGGVVRLVRRILAGTLIFELAGAAILVWRFLPHFNLADSIWIGIFHSVSAFCNAGFDIMGRLAPYSSLTFFRYDVAVNITVMCLIVIGGIGFIVWDDVYRHKIRFHHYALHSKVALTATAVLIPISALLFFVLERNGVFQDMSTSQSMLAALFQAVTPRTAGFNTVDTANLSEGGSLLTILLMIVGAGTGSTAGGIKTTTMMVLLFAVLANVRGRNDVNMFNRRLGPELVNKAFCGATIHVVLALGSALLLVAIQGFTIKEALFETVSAIGTVGLTTGITRDLVPLTRMIVILLMFAGRLGSLSVFMAAVDTRTGRQLRNIEEKIMVG